MPDKEAGHQTKGVGAGGASLVAMPPPSEEAEALCIFYNDILMIHSVIGIKLMQVFVLNCM